VAKGFRKEIKKSFDITGVLWKITTITVVIMNSVKIETNDKRVEKTDWQEVVRRQVDSLHYGTVQIIVHDSQVTQIEKTERVRLDRPRAQKI
jgi:hypothetical protein